MIFLVRTILTDSGIFTGTILTRVMSRTMGYLLGQFLLNQSGGILSGTEYGKAEVSARTLLT